MILNSRRGFTLIELLVVIAIIGILSTLAIVALSSARQKARDAKRVADLNQVSKALELYYTNNNSYPTIITAGQALSDGTTTYLSAIPENPRPRNEGSCADAGYSYTSNGTSYTLSGCLSAGTGNLSGGTFFATSQGVASCGITLVDRDGYTYSTVQIGGQCWMAENLRVKTKPDGSALTNLSNNSERDCIAVGPLRGTETDCNAGYSLYTWAAAMNGSTTEGVQGICPYGWHIPTDSEFNTLEQFLKDTPATSCDATRNGSADCPSAGTKLKVSGSSNFNGILTGYRNTNGTTFNSYGTQGYYWSSTESTATLTWTHWLASSSNQVGRGVNSKTYAFGVRCLKN